MTLVPGEQLFAELTQRRGDMDKSLSNPFGVPTAPGRDVDESYDDDAEDDPRRGTSNSNERGSAEDRRRRKAWLMEAYRADLDLRPGHEDDPWDEDMAWVTRGEGTPAVRCFRCGKLLSVEHVIVSRIVMGDAGTYRRANLRPACEDCADIVGKEYGESQRANH